MASTRRRRLQRLLSTVEGFLKVAGDGACPNGQGDLKLRGSGAGVYYGRGSKHNSVIPIKGAAQGAQRGEVRAALRWALSAWSKTVCIIDSQQAKDGIEAILQRKKKKQKSHRDLWKRIAAALYAKRLANHKVENVKANKRKNKEKKKRKKKPASEKGTKKLTREQWQQQLRIQHRVSWRREENKWSKLQE